MASASRLVLVVDSESWKKWKIKNARCSKNASCMKKARCRMNGVPPAGEELGGSMSMGVHGPRLPVL